ncbi:hypothetical protein [Megamonas funiformis]
MTILNNKHKENVLKRLLTNFLLLSKEDQYYILGRIEAKTENIKKTLSFNAKSA